MNPQSAQSNVSVVFRTGTVGLVVAMSLLSVAAARGADIHFVAPSGGAWNMPGNWDLGRVPAHYDEVSIIAGPTTNMAVDYDGTGGIALTSVMVDGTGAKYGAIWQLAHVMQTEKMWLGLSGDAWHWMEGPAYLSITDRLDVGHRGGGIGHFYLATVGVGNGSGLSVAGDGYVGYQTTGEFDHTAGGAEFEHLFVGHDAEGTYWLRGSTSASALDVTYYTLIGNAAAGTFEQTGGTHTTVAVYLGLNTGGEGVYLLKGGVLDVDRISIAFNGDGEMEQSGGSAILSQSFVVGADGAHPFIARYEISDADGAASLNVGDNIYVGRHSQGAFIQSGGAVTVGGDLLIEDDDPTVDGYGRVYLNTGAGTLQVSGAVRNTDGYYDQNDGVATVGSFINASAAGVNLNNQAELQTRTFTNVRGTVRMFGDALLRGPLAFPPSTYWRCNFINDGIFQMGTVAANGGTFSGTLTNNGTFTYFSGDFAGSILINHGVFDNHAPFTCQRMENHSSLAVTSAGPLTVDGGGYTTSIENYGDMTIAAGGEVTLGAGKPLVNHGTLSGGGTDAAPTTIHGDVENDGYLVPSAAIASGKLRIGGYFKATGNTELRVRLYGTTDVSQYDVLRVDGTATLSGTLSVRLGKFYVPQIGDVYGVVSCAARVGEFSALDLPALPDDRRWSVRYLSTGVVLDVLAQPGDCNADGTVDLADHADLVACLTGPAAHGATTCRCFDLNYDGQVDLLDFQMFQSLFTGP